MGDRRFEQRFATFEPVEVRWTDARGDQAYPGYLRDYSRSGARIEMEQPIRLQTPVQVTIKDRQLSGSVKSCARNAFGFTLGLEFAADYEGVLTALRRKS
jgi:hypothetical protein